MAVYSSCVLNMGSFIPLVSQYDLATANTAFVAERVVKARFVDLISISDGREEHDSGGKPDSGSNGRLTKLRQDGLSSGCPSLSR